MRLLASILLETQSEGQEEEVPQVEYVETSLNPGTARQDQLGQGNSSLFREGAYEEIPTGESIAPCDASLLAGPKGRESEEKIEGGIKMRVYSPIGEKKEQEPIP